LNHPNARRRGTRRLPFCLAALAIALVGADASLRPGTADATVSSYSCHEFASNPSPGYRGWLSAINSVQLSSGPDMTGLASTVNGVASAPCTAVAGWSAEVAVLGFYLSGTSYVGCPGAYNVQMSTNGIAAASVLCDGAQAYKLATSHRVWFAGSERGSGWMYRYASW